MKSCTFLRKIVEGTWHWIITGAVFLHFWKFWRIVIISVVFQKSVLTHLKFDIIAKYFTFCICLFHCRGKKFQINASTRCLIEAILGDTQNMYIRGGKSSISLSEYCQKWNSWVQISWKLWPLYFFYIKFSFLIFFGFYGGNSDLTLRCFWIF